MKISVVIRAKNEESYIGACLKKLFSQSLPPHEVVVVDNFSTDRTSEIAEALGARVVKIRDYSPGRAINLGISETTGDVIAIISAHCVPKDEFWLANLTLPFHDERSHNIVGVYGRQLPLPYSHPQDKRDLYAVFGEEDRVQEKSSFFHNANSAVLRDAWLKVPFDEATAHIEDRVWASSVQAAGGSIYYSSRAEVYHWNGMHASTDLVRANNAIGVLSSLGVAEESLPSFLLPENVTVLPIIPARTRDKDSMDFQNQLADLSAQISMCEFLSDPVFVCESDSPLALVHPHTIVTLDDDLTVETAISLALQKFEDEGNVADYVLYANPEYLERDESIFETLIRAVLRNGSDTAFCGYQDFGHFWVETDQEKWQQVDDSMEPREKRMPTYRALYGLGTVTRASIARRGSLVGEGVTIIPIASYSYRALARGGLEFHQAGREAPEPSRHWR